MWQPADFSPTGHCRFCQHLLAFSLTTHDELRFCFCSFLFFLTAEQMTNSHDSKELWMLIYALRYLYFLFVCTVVFARCSTTDIHKGQCWWKSEWAMKKNYTLLRLLKSRFWEPNWVLFYIGVLMEGWKYLLISKKKKKNTEKCSIFKLRAET